MRPSVSRLFFGSPFRSSAAPRSSPLNPASAVASESTAISPAQSTGAISQWRSRLPAATAEDYPQPSSKVFSFDKLPPPPPRRKKFHAFLTSLVTIVGLGLPIWIIYSQIMQARNNTHQKELVDKIMALKHPELVGVSKPTPNDSIAAHVRIDVFLVSSNHNMSVVLTNSKIFSHESVRLLISLVCSSFEPGAQTQHLPIFSSP
ncbi:hypothetical protein [Phaffia rhodozyma]|uniref:Uncharacterized protein n=1 Tax=Phaffia rhodozyma TaxID=264483 RepID=A0A0F7SRW6_PHARH|nr:hypothetical protein [Phaffia rhodozyma]